jgi:cold shock CspA family protein
MGFSLSLNGKMKIIVHISELMRGNQNLKKESKNVKK